MRFPKRYPALIWYIVPYNWLFLTSIGLLPRFRYRIVIANGQKTSILILVSYFHGLFRLISSVFVVLFSTVMYFLLVYIHKPPIDHHIIFWTFENSLSPSHGYRNKLNWRWLPPVKKTVVLFTVLFLSWNLPVSVVYMVKKPGKVFYVRIFFFSKG